jgi:HEAT repeat protein
MSDAAASWSAWKQATFGDGYTIWHEGLDVGAVTGLRGEARAQARTMLRLGLSLGDDHAATALAAMGDDTAIADMLALLADASGSERVRLALAVHRLRREPALAAHLVAVLQGEGDWGPRIDAAIGLRQFAGADDEAALLAAVADHEYLVRYHACETLLARWRVRPTDVSRHRKIFARICGPEEGAPGDADLARFAAARELLLARRPAGA